MQEKEVLGMKTSYKNTRGIFNFFFRFREWLDIDRTTTTGKTILEKMKIFFGDVVRHSSSEKQKQEFEKVTNEFGLTALQIEQQAKRLRIWSFLLFVFTFVVGAVGVYQFVHSFFRASVVTFIVMGISFTMSFRYNFFAYQMQQRKLGCSVGEWFKKGIIGREK